MASRLIIGLMSGTSVDGIDVALVRVEGRAGKYRAKVLTHAERSWPKKLRARLLAAMAPSFVATSQICELNMLVAMEMAEATKDLIRAAGVKRSRITAVASHGQTICHLPMKNAKHKTGVAKPGSTLQLGDVSVLATLTGLPAVGNFRPADMAVGGQGAPLVPWTDDVLLADNIKTRCVQNIGGIANVTFLPPRGEKERKVIAFDTGPGNMMIDAAIVFAPGRKRGFDEDGRYAARGAVDLPLFRQLQALPYFRQHPPKSTGREDFGAPFTHGIILKYPLLKIENVIHTLTRFTAWSIADAYLHFLPRLPDEVIICGGGADNPVLMSMLKEELGRLISEFVGPKEVVLRRIDEFGIPNKAKEAASFALLGAATLDGVPANLPSVTGAARGVVLGVVARP